MTWWLLLPLVFLLWFSHRYGWWMKTVPYQHPRILMYHMISEPESKHKFKGLRVSPQAFEQQVAYLADQGWNFVTMQELMSASSMPEKTVAITFDDGYEDNFTQALPILKKYGAKATLYLVVDRHDRDWSSKKKAHHNNGELAKEIKLSDQQVKQMLASGVFELGAHTLTHVNLSKAPEAIKRLEIIGSKEQLEKRFQVEVNSFAYPFGIYDAQDAKIAQEAGYLSSVTTVDGIDLDLNRDPQQLKRVKISGKDNFYAFKLRMRIGRRGVKS